MLRVVGEYEPNTKEFWVCADPEQTVDVAEFMRGLHQRWCVAVPRDWHLNTTTSAAVTIDRDRMTIALDELLENAVRHTQAGDRIALDAVVCDGTVSFSVADSGSGIPLAAQARVFDRFYRVDGDRNRRSGGAGLGLSLVRAVAEAHGGGVSVSSNPGGGSVFTIKLPVSVAGPQAVAPAADGLDPHAGVQLAT